MESLISAINKYPTGTIIIIKWVHAQEIIARTITLDESDNGLDDDADGYNEFYVFIIKIIEILKKSILYKNVKAGDLIELSMEDPPIEVKLEDGTVIWSKDTVSTEIWKTHFKEDDKTDS